jgi:hypothetical protein
MAALLLILGVAMDATPGVPFFADQAFLDLSSGSNPSLLKSEAEIGQVHLLGPFPKPRDIRTNRNGLREPDRTASRRYGAIQGALRERHPTKNLYQLLKQPSVPILEERHSVVQRRFRLFNRSGAHGTMRPWLTLAYHANTIRRMDQSQEDAAEERLEQGRGVDDDHWRSRSARIA